MLLAGDMPHFSSRIGFVVRVHSESTILTHSKLIALWTMLPPTLYIQARFSACVLFGFAAVLPRPNLSSHALVRCSSCLPQPCSELRLKGGVLAGGCFCENLSGVLCLRSESRVVAVPCCALQHPKLMFSPSKGDGYSISAFLDKTGTFDCLP